MKRTAIAISLVTGIALWSTAAEVRAQPPAAPTPGEAPIEQRPVRPNRRLLIGGATIVALSYGPAIAVAATSDREGDEWLYVPVIGPWADLFDREGCGGDCGQEALYKTLLIAGGLAHVIGVGSIIASFFIPEQRTRVGGTPEMPKANVHFSPMQVGRAGYGIGVGGHF